MASPPMDFPTRTPKDPMPVDPRTILAALVHLDHKAIPFGPYGCGFNGPFGPYGYSGNTLPPMALNRNITTPTNLTTLKHVKAVPTLTTKTEDAHEPRRSHRAPAEALLHKTFPGSPLDKTSSDSKKEEKSPGEPASARPECVHFEEKQASVPSQENPTADLDDKPCVSPSMGRYTDLRNNGDLDNERHEQERLAEPPYRQKIPADTRSKAPPVGKESAADKVSADPVQRRSKDLKRGCPTEAALDKDSVVGRALYMQRLVPPQNLAGGWRRGKFSASLSFTPRGQSVTIDNDQKFRKERNITSTQMEIDSGSGTGSVTPERVAAIKRGEAAMQQQFASLMSASAPPPAPLLPPREALPFHHIFDGNKTMFKSGHTATVLRTFMDSISFM
ncbi:hypothetical protein E4U38_006796 [Claviceps purpurea]|nr:hypothetical protein E4U38_006796 [Claviceps purpurea]